MSAQPSKNTHFFSGIITTIGPPKERTDKLIDSIHKKMSEAIQMMKIFPRWTRLRLHVWFSVKLDGKCLSFDSTTFQKKKNTELNDQQHHIYHKWFIYNKWVYKEVKILRNKRQRQKYVYFFQEEFWAFNLLSKLFFFNHSPILISRIFFFVVRAEHAIRETK